VFTVYYIVCSLTCHRPEESCSSSWTSS